MPQPQPRDVWVSRQREFFRMDRTPQGEVPLYVYAGVAGRFWYGDRGKSAWESASALFHSPVLKQDKTRAEQEARENVVQEIARGIYARTGMLLTRGNQTLDRIEWNIIWEADGTLLRRLRFFEDGHVAQILKAGVSLKDLTSDDIRRIVQGAGGSRVLPETGKLILPPGAEQFRRD